MNEARETELLLPITNQDIDSETTSASLQRNSGLTKLLGSVTQFFTSGRLLNVLSFVNGLRDPRKEGLWAAVFTTALVVTDSVYLACLLLLNIYPWIESKICPDMNTRTRNKDIESLVFLMQYLSVVSSHFMFLFCLLKLDNGKNTIKPNDASLLNNRPFWIKTNVPLVLSGLALISITFLTQTLDNGCHHSKIELRFYIVLALYSILQSIAVWRSIVNCCMFGMIMMALNDCVKKCEIEIKNLQSDEVNDAIAIHQHLCARVLSTSDTLTLWFITNWLTLVFISVLYIGAFSEIFHSWYVYYSNLWYICIFLFLFLYPCYSAASVTSKCRQILIDMNMTTPEDWPPDHPFKQRGQLLQFIQYAEYTQCGFRVGNTVFGTNYAWISTLLALIIGVAKFLYN